MAKDDWKKSKRRVSAWLSLEAKARLDLLQGETGESVSEVFEGFLLAQHVAHVTDAITPETGPAELKALKARLDAQEERLAALEAVLVAQKVGPVVEDAKSETAPISDAITDITEAKGHAGPDVQGEPSFTRATKRPPRTKPLTDDEKRQFILACAVIAVEQGSHLLKAPADLWDKLGPSEQRMMKRETFKLRLERAYKQLVFQAVRDLEKATREKRQFTEDNVRLEIEKREA